MPRKPLVATPPGADYSIRVVGDRATPLRDFYHALLRWPWSATITAISALFLAANALFAAGYLITGGIAHAAPGSFVDAFFFSVQTMGTIGYGAMYPESAAANILVVAEAITGLTLTALATGLVFAKFSRSTARIVFTREVVIATSLWHLSCDSDGDSQDRLMRPNGDSSWMAGGISRAFAPAGSVYSNESRLTHGDSITRSNLRSVNGAIVWVKFRPEP